MKRIVFIVIALAALVIVIYGVFTVHRKKMVDDSLKQVFSSGTNQGKILNNLREMGAKAVPAEVQALSQTGEVGSAAELALLNNRSATNGLTDIVRLLENKNPEVRQRAADVIMDQIANRIRSPDVSVLPALIRALSDTNEYVREDMALALGKFGSKAATAVPTLTTALDDDSARVRIVAAMSLSEIDRNQNGVAIPILKDVMTNGNPRDRHWAAVYLHKIDPKNTEIIPVFIGSLTNEESGIRISAAYSLRPYGSQANAAVPTLLDMLKDTDSEVRKSAWAALEKINPDTLKNSNSQTNGATP